MPEGCEFVSEYISCLALYFPKLCLYVYIAALLLETFLQEKTPTAGKGSGRWGISRDKLHQLPTAKVFSQHRERSGNRERPTAAKDWLWGGSNERLCHLSTAGAIPHHGERFQHMEAAGSDLSLSPCHLSLSLENYLSVKSPPTRWGWLLDGSLSLWSVMTRVGSFRCCVYWLISAACSFSSLVRLA